MKKSSTVIIGAGSWGSAIAIHLARHGLSVQLWAHDQQHVKEMVAERCNRRYLPQYPFPPTLTPNADLMSAISQAEYVIVAVPSHAFATLVAQLPTKIAHLAWLTKGLNPSDHTLLSQLITDKWGDHLPFAVISGPSFAREVAADLPTALVIAGNHPPYLTALQTLFHRGHIRAYLSDDWIGVQIGGAVKNVLAIACGISDGLAYGANAKAALITRGLAEMRRLGLCLGAQAETFLGLAGVGDLVLTCTDNQSRNRRFGLALGQGHDPISAEKHIGQVVEGKYNAAQVVALAEQYHLEMPICQAVHALLQGKLTPQQAVQQLMQRPPKDE